MNRSKIRKAGRRRLSSRRSERRGSPRIEMQVPMNLAVDGEMLITRTKNLSASGAYCTLRRFLEPMTKLQVQLELPGRPRPTKVVCYGVVVRIEPPRPLPKRSSYHIAIFFHDIAARTRSIIAQYVRERMQGACSPAAC